MTKLKDFAIAWLGSVVVGAALLIIGGLTLSVVFLVPFLLVHFSYWLAGLYALFVTVPVIGWCIFNDD